MPTFVKSDKQLARDRAAFDTESYYSGALKKIQESALSEKTTESTQDLLRAKKWISTYEDWAFNWHMKNLSFGEDGYVDFDKAKYKKIKKPKAPRLTFLSDIVD